VGLGVAGGEEGGSEEVGKRVIEGWKIVRWGRGDGVGGRGGGSRERGGRCRGRGKDLVSNPGRGGGCGRPPG